MTQQISASSRTAGDGFFSTMGTVLGDAWGKISQDVLPIWVADQLGVNKPNTPISNPAYVNTGNNASAGNIANAQPGSTATTGGLIPGVSNTTLIVVGGGLVALILLNKYM